MAVKRSDHFVVIDEWVIPSMPNDDNGISAGRFARNDIVSLLDVNRKYNLAESTSRDLMMHELLALPGMEAIGTVRLGYGTSRGLDELRRVVGELCGMPSDRIVTTTGTALGLAMLALELCGPGQHAVIATPSFPPSRDTLLAGGGTVTQVAMRFDRGYQLDVGAIGDVLSVKTSLVSIASPQNPSGVRASIGDIDSLLAVMAQRSPNAWLFVDETYREAAHGDNAEVASVAARHPRIITGGSVSKAHGAPGLRVGWLTVPDDGLRQRLITAKMNLIISGSPLNEAIAAVLLRHGQAVLAPRRALLGRALGMVQTWIVENGPLIEWVKPDAGAMCCVRLRPDVWDAAAVARFWDTLPGADLQLAEGTWFGESRRVMRLGFGFVAEDVLACALAAMSEVLHRTPK